MKEKCCLFTSEQNRFFLYELVFPTSQSNCTCDNWAFFHQGVGGVGKWPMPGSGYNVEFLQKLNSVLALRVLTYLITPFAKSCAIEKYHEIKHVWLKDL